MGALWNAMTSMSATGYIATSLIAKDAVGCYLYVNQARKNKKFTPKQRADVANYDLANGVINIGLQLLAVKPIEKAMTWFVKRNWLEKFFQKTSKTLAGADNKKMIKYLKASKTLTEGAVALLSVIVCQYIIKRGISPYFSVPAGEKMKQIGLVKPKLYPGETFTGKEEAKPQETKAPAGVYFDVMSVADADTNLLRRGVKYYTQA